MSSPQAAVVLVEYHSGGLVAARAAEAEAAGLMAVVADNSGDYDGPGLIVRTGGNVGFGAACNAAVNALGPDIDVLILQNPDALADGTDVQTLVSLVREGPWVALAPSVLADRLRPAGFAVPGRLRDVLLVVRDCIEARRRVSRITPHIETASPAAGPPTPRTEPRRFATAAFMVVDRAAFEAIGGFETTYFLYLEDLDLWQRLRSRGDAAFVPEILVRHHQGTGAHGSTTRRTLLRWLGRETFAHRSARGWRHLRVLHRMGLRALPSLSADPVAEAVVAGFRTFEPPASIQRSVRRVAKAADGCSFRPGGA